MTEATATPPPQPSTSSPPGSPPGASSAGSIAMLMVGLLLFLIGLAPLIGGAALGGVLAQQNAGGFLTAPAVAIAADSYALTSPDVEIASDVPQLPFDIGTVQLTARGSSGSEIFVGLARQVDVERYLAGVHHTEVVEVSPGSQVTRLRDLPGTVTPDLPGNEDFWVESSTGTGRAELQARIESGDWAVVVMNADASAGVQVVLQAGFRSDWFGPLAAWLFISGFVLCLIGLPLLVLGVIGIGQRMNPTGSPVDTTRYPAHLTGELESTPSQWLWLVKWFLAIPHYVVLSFLWFALLITSVGAWFAILFTGRYPRALFDFNVGVLRWTWRVGFYSYSALGTDRYPPFTLSSTSFPADFTIEYPHRLSRGLIFVKSWFLAIPHLLLVGAVTGSTFVFTWPMGWWSEGGPNQGRWMSRGWASSAWSADSLTRVGGVSIVGLLVLVVGVSLLFRNRYPIALFDLLLGIHRWGFRVIAYVGLFRDEYPPFRLDQGPRGTGPSLPVPEYEPERPGPSGPPDSSGPPESSAPAEPSPPR
jgi:hypothetical protein